jgi:hypothetical protein
MSNIVFKGLLKAVEPSTLVLEPPERSDAIDSSEKFGKRVPAPEKK